MIRVVLPNPLCVVARTDSNEVLLEEYVLQRPEYQTVPPPPIDGETFEDVPG